MRIHPPSQRLAPIAAAVARAAFCVMPESDAQDVANNMVGALDGFAELGAEIDPEAAFAKRIREMVRDFGPGSERPFFCADVAMAGRLMGAEYRRQTALEKRAQGEAA